MNLLILDNYDSFTYNLVHLVKHLGYSPVIKRNDKISLDDVDAYDKILLSPGPGIPEEAGIMMDLIKRYAPTKSIMGVCLGHQGISEAFGAKLHNLDLVYHGIVTDTEITDAEEILFKDLPTTLKTCRYHSWVVDPEGLPNCLEVTATNSEGRIMAIRHKEFDVRGVQFHPESFLTEGGETMLKNWLES
ncbi:aminodeoxychorismate/anthranilate synthase component II [Flammeovirgaceae bacterium SG7u.111]|nr:aminodeoxychorismate/anthranilate synthase component II [Flammeovirgaceae bacterium SG7u.132]WPO35366.1 aminodeoxychorismate/anthranilate synthase component II [Flammeovirgaceae bacterium SG7u.111]